MHNYPAVTDRKIRIALVGCGRISANHFGAIEQHADNVELVDVCDVNAAALAQAVARTKASGHSNLADLLKTNRTYISQSIIDHSGQTFRDYLKSYRIKEAMEFLADKKRAKMFSIEGIAKEVGFNTIGPFNAAFKEITGLTPSQFRHQAGNN